MAGLADGILPHRFHPGETVPKGLNRDEVVRLLSTTEGDRPADVRARAVLMVLITYGMRAGEVAGLRLDDLDWAEKRLQVRRPKLDAPITIPCRAASGRRSCATSVKSVPSARKERCSLS